MKGFVSSLYNDCWHGFWVRSWWPHVFWQVVTLWLVNRRMAVRRSRPSKQVWNQKETIWYENHEVRFRQSVLSESSPGYAADQRHLYRLWRYDLQWDAIVGTSCFHEEDMGQEKSPFLSVCLFIFSQTYKKQCTHFENKMSEVHFYKEICFVSFIEVRFLSFVMFLVWSVNSIQDFLMSDIHKSSVLVRSKFLRT